LLPLKTGVLFERDPYQDVKRYENAERQET